MKKKLTATIIIPTCYGGDSLIATAKSLYDSTNVAEFRFIIISDRNPIKPMTKKILNAMGVEIYWNRVEGSQPKKLLQARKKVTSDLYIFTQDDIHFEPETLSSIINAFEKNPKLTMAAAGVLPVEKSETLVEKGMASNIRMVYNIARDWKHGKNYLAASGRCLAFRMSLFSQYTIPEILVNADMYFYLENARLGGMFTMLPEARIYIRPPQKLKDQVGPSSRFQYQNEELKKFFPFDYSKEYILPKAAVFKAAITELFTHPVGLLSYGFIFAYTRLKKQSKRVVGNPVWKVDVSTKQI
jgi:hypothetical protein